MRLSERISSSRHLAMSLLIMAASLEYALVNTNYHGALTCVKAAAVLALAWGFYLDQRLIYSNWQMKLSGQMLLHVALLIVALFGFQASIACIRMLMEATGEYGPEQSERFEIGLQMIGYPLLLALLCACTNGYIRWLRRNAKNVTLLLYLFLWIWCGAFYYYMAERTKGDDFVFSEQAKIQTTLKGISADDKYDAYDRYRLAEILKKSQYKQDYIKLPSNEYLTLASAGINWGEIYEDRYVREGYRYYSFAASPEPYLLDPKLLDYESLEAWEPFMHKPYTEVEVRLYKSNDDAAGANAALKYLSPGDAKPAGESGLGKPSKTVKLYFAEREYEPFMQVFKNDQEDKHLSRLIAASHTLLDSDFLELYIGINGYVNYHVEDFWYFSAITITTLGFGDITPNSTPVRRVVMFETLFGVLLLGFYMSKVGLNKQQREQAGTNSADESIR